jgi:hypothetical protein
MQKHRFVTGLFDGADKLRSPEVVDIGYRDRGTFARQQVGDRCTYAGCTAGNNCDFSLDLPCHFRSLPLLKRT